MRRKSALFAASALLALLIAACTCRRGEIGTEQNPVRFHFMPLKGEEVFRENAPVIENYIREKTGLAVKSRHSRNFIDIIKALGQRRSDIAFINTLGYVLAHDWTLAEAPLKYLYADVYDSYRGGIMTRTDSGLDSVAELDGKTIAFADPYSAGGYIYPLKLLHDHGVSPGQIVFAGGHKKAVQMLYDGEVDAAASYHNMPSPEGLIRDARAEIAAEHPDVISKLRIIALTDEIPSGPIAMRHDLPEEIKRKLTGALMEFSRTPEGRKTLFDLYNITGFAEASDADYDSVRSVLKELDKKVQEVVRGGISFYRTYIVPGLE